MEQSCEHIARMILVDFHKAISAPSVAYSYLCLLKLANILLAWLEWTPVFRLTKTRLIFEMPMFEFTTKSNMLLHYTEQSLCMLLHNPWACVFPSFKPISKWRKKDKETEKKTHKTSGVKKNIFKIFTVRPQVQS